MLKMSSTLQNNHYHAVARYGTGVHIVLNVEAL